MEISSFSKLEHLDSPQKGTNRSIKPADRYVISYDFEQINSQCITHNLLIGMAPQPSKKINKDCSFNSLDHTKSKITRIAPSNKKISRLNHRDIAKVYDSNVPATMYVNANSPRKLSRQLLENKSYHQNQQYSQYHSSRYQIPQNESFFQKQNENGNIQEGSFLTNPFKEPFNEEQERKKSPYYSKYKPREEARKSNNSTVDPNKKQNYVPRHSRQNSINSRKNASSSMRNTQYRSKPGNQTSHNWKDAPIIPGIDAFKTSSNSTLKPSNHSVTKPTNSTIISKYATLFSNAFKSIPSNNSQAKNAKLNTFNIKRKEKGSTNKIVPNRVVQKQNSEDITQNNVIKGYRMQEKVVPKVSSPRIHSNSKQGSFTKNKAKINTIPDEQKLKKVSYLNPKAPPLNSRNAHMNSQASRSNSKIQHNSKSPQQKLNFLNRLSESKQSVNKSFQQSRNNSKTFFKQNSQVSPRTNRSKDHIIENERSKRQRNSSVPIDTDRTVKRQNNKSRSTFSNDKNKLLYPHEEGPLSRRSRDSDRSVSNAPPAPTIPRSPRDKKYKFKNWRESAELRALNKQKETKIAAQANKKVVRKSPSPPIKNDKPSHKSKRNNKQKQIDLDAEEDDKFGLNAQKNVTIHKKKPLNKSPPKKPNKQNDPNSKKVNSKRTSKPSNFSNNQDEQILQEGQKSQEHILKDQPDSKRSNNLSEEEQQEQYTTTYNTVMKNNSKKQSPSKIANKFDQNQIKQVTEEYHKTTQGQINSFHQEQEQKKQGVKQIEQLINQNGSLSSINDSYDQKKAEKDPNQEEPLASPAKQTSKQASRNNTALATPVPLPMPQDNLYELMKATEQVNPNKKQLEPILNKVEADLQKSRQIEQLGQEEVGQSPPSMKQPSLKQQQSQVEIVPIQQTDRNLERLGFSNNQNNNNILSPHFSARGQNQTDYHDELLDKIAEMPSADHKDKSEEYFQCNLKETSKINSTINHTKYEHVDKDMSNYTRAPILTFLYEIPKQTQEKAIKFEASNNLNQSVKRIQTASQIDDPIFDQAIDMLLSIDPWIIERIFEPYEDKDGKTGIWLYCHGNWKLFLEDRQINFRTSLKSACKKALEEISQRYDLEPLLKLISGVRIMRLKSSKKKLFGQIQYSLRKGHAVKAYTSSNSKWGKKIFEVVKVQTTVKNQNVIQIKHENDRYWIKEEKFKEIFEHFLLIGARPSHFWTHRLLNHQPNHKMVINITSHVPTHGSITLYYPSNKPSSLLLYRELQSQVLKFMGQIQEKPNQNGNLYFEFKLNGPYSLFLETPTSCLLAIESSSPLDIGLPEYIASQTLKNEQCEYVELNQSKSKLKDSALRNSNASVLRNTNGMTLDWLREKFIKMVVKK